MKNKFKTSYYATLKYTGETLQEAMKRIRDKRKRLAHKKKIVV